mgnify:CR=1 FL=1
MGRHGYRAADHIAIPPAAAGGMTTAAKCWATAGVVLSASGGIVAI